MSPDDQRKGASAPQETNSDSGREPGTDPHVSNGSDPATNHVDAAEEHLASGGAGSPADPHEQAYVTGDYSGGGQAGQADPPPYQSPNEDPYGAYHDPYGYNLDPEPYPAPKALTTASQPPAPPSPPTVGKADNPDPDEEEDEDDDGMLRMSFLEHLEELRSRLIKMVAGLVTAFAVALTFTDPLWNIIRQPAKAALETLGVNPPNLVMTSPMDGFTIIWMKLPLLCAVFLASPWILYQIWAFVAPGLYKRERRYAVPFVLCSAALFLMGGAFAYFVAFRFGLTFLLGIGFSQGVTPFISVVEYFDLFINVMLGVALVFELPVLIFFLTLLRIASPGFLLRHSRYAILGIVVLAAIVTPTPDVFNLTIFAVPMVFLYFLGIFASYLLTLNREQKRFPWGKFLVFASIPILLAALSVALAIYQFGFKLVPTWPFLVR
jgi:sec-independent protein translocase protein TatC